MGQLFFLLFPRLTALPVLFFALPFQGLAFDPPSFVFSPAGPFQLQAALLQGFELPQLGLKGVKVDHTFGIDRNVAELMGHWDGRIGLGVGLGVGQVWALGGENRTAA